MICSGIVEKEQDYYCQQAHLTTKVLKYYDLRSTILMMGDGYEEQSIRRQEIQPQELFVNSYL